MSKTNREAQVQQETVHSKQTQVKGGSWASVPGPTLSPSASRGTAAEC